MRRSTIIAWMAAVLLAGCGGSTKTITGLTPGSGSSSSSSSSSGGTGSSSGSTIATPTSLTATTSATSIPADGSAPATITVLARNSSNQLISGVAVQFSASSGGIAVVQGTTDSTGAATATLSTAGDSSLRTITVTATAAGLTATVQVQVVATSSATTSVVSSLTLSTSANSILSDGSTTATVTALARDAANNVLAGVPVTFTASSGAIQSSGALTGASGTVTAIVSTGDDSALRTIVVTGSTSSLSSTVQIGVVAPTTPTAPVYTMGNGSGSSFVASKIGGLPASGDLSAGGTATVNVTIVDQTDTLYTGGAVTVTFNSKCISNGQAQILPNGSTTPVTSISTTTGSINATYVATGCSGPDTILASASVAGQSVSASGTLTIAAATIGAIQFISASPTTIGLKGTGLNETSIVIFKVTDSSGGTPSGVPVTFSLDSTVGGISLSPASATSLADGTVQTVVSSGTVHTVVRVTASIASPALSTQSSQLTVTTGLPASNGFDISVGGVSYGSGSTVTVACPNVEALNIDGVSVPITARLADRYNNPVPDGTAVAFWTNGGHIVGNCNTPGPTPGDGTCTVNWTSANPRPGYDNGVVTGTPDLLAGFPSSYTPGLISAGRASILATTIGEESFTDDNASGFYQSGDPFTNLGEPFSDENEVAASNSHTTDGYELGDYFLDFNQNGHWDAPSGSFVGITCTGTTSGSTCTSQTLAIGASALLIMSSSLPNLYYNSNYQTVDPSFVLLSAAGSFNTSGSIASASGDSLSITPLSIAQGDSGTITLNLQDRNGNSMAAGTTVSFSYTSTVLATSSPPGVVTPTTPFVVPCDSGLGGQLYQATFTASGSVSGAGVITVTIVSPNGSTTTLSIPVNVT